MKQKKEVVMMIQRNNNLYRIFFLLTDLIALNLVSLILFSGLPHITTGTMKDIVVLNLMSNILWVVSSYLTAIYILYKDINLKILVKRTAISLCIFGLSMIIFSCIHNYQFDRIYTLFMFSGYGLFLLVSRLVLISYVLYTRTNSRFYKNIVIIGGNETANSLGEIIYANQTNVRVVGYFDNTLPIDPLQRYPYLGAIDDCLTYAVQHHIAEIYCTLSPEGFNELYTMAEEAEKKFIRFRFVPDLRKFIGRKVHVDFIENIPVLSLRAEPMQYATAQIKKRIFDVIISSIVLLFLLSWLLPILAILIKLDSKGPVFFSQKRSGRNNEDFSCLKLRTLKAHNHADSASIQVTQNDSRTTRIGRFLRKSSLDELPQFINVLMGQMSIVGARPHMLKHTIDFASIENKYMVRHLSKPGVTGWAQINGYRGEIKNPGQLTKRIEHDIWYIENWNILLDLKIVFLTVYLTIKGDKNAY